MSRNFAIFLIVMFLLLVAAITVRVSLFTYDGVMIFVYDKADDDMVQRRRVVYRDWYQRINDRIPYDYRPNLRIYLVPILFPEISYRYPNVAVPLARESPRVNQLLALSRTFKPGPYEQFMIRYSERSAGEIVFYHLGLPAHVFQVPWTSLDPAAGPPVTVR